MHSAKLYSSIACRLNVFSFSNKKLISPKNIYQFNDLNDWDFAILTAGKIILSFAYTRGPPIPKFGSFNRNFWHINQFEIALVQHTPRKSNNNL